MLFKELATEAEVLALIEFHNEKSEYVVIDIETSGLNPHNDTITDIILSGESENSASIFAPGFVTALKRLTRPVVCHNFKFDFSFLYRSGVDLRVSGLFADTLLYDHLIDENQEHSLDSIVKRRYNDNYKEVFWAKYKAYGEAPKEEQINYACKDVVYTRRLFEDLRAESKHAGIPDQLIKHVHRLALELYETEITGVKLDIEYLRTVSETLTAKIASLLLEMRSLVDTECKILELDQYLVELDKRKTDRGKAGVKKPQFNFDSTRQLGDLLYNQLELPIQLNKERKRTVDDAALEKLETSHGIVGKLREYRGYQKTFTSFIEGSLTKMQHGRIYPSFNVNGTVTGRISSSNPNMQQLPKNGGVRGIYIPDPGYKFISCDYKQLEVTLAAHFSRDQNLLSIVYDGASQHDITAKGLGVDRQTAKTINFALQYGAGARKIQSILGCSEKEAEKALKRYWETYSGLQTFIKQCHSKVESGEPLVNPFGRRRRFPDPKTLNFWELERCKRQAANSVIQGTGADCTSMALYLVGAGLKTKGWGRALFSVHDEIIISVLDDRAMEGIDLLQKLMIAVGEQISLTVPLSVDCSGPMTRWED